MPPRNDAEEEVALARGAPARAAAAGVRLGHLRRGRVAPGSHHPGHRADRRGDHAAAGRAPDGGRPLGRRAAAGDRLVRLRRGEQHPGAARRSARRPHGGMGLASAGAGVRRRAGARSPARSATSASVSRPTRHAPAVRPISSPTPVTWSRRSDAGADYAITQMLFSADDYLAPARPDGARPARTCRCCPGIMPITSLRAAGADPASCPASAIPTDLAARLLGRRERPRRRPGDRDGACHLDERAAAARRARRACTSTRSTDRRRPSRCWPPWGSHPALRR